MLDSLCPPEWPRLRDSTYAELERMAGSLTTFRSHRAHIPIDDVALDEIDAALADLNARLTTAMERCAAGEMDCG